MKKGVFRLFSSVVLLFLITFVSFLIIRLAPGDPSLMMLDPKLSTADRDLYLQQLGLDQPLPTQYFSWVSRVLHGDLGYSIVSSQPVLNVIVSRLFPTVLLMGTSFLLIFCFSLPLGVWSGYKKDSSFDVFLTFFSFVLMAMPTFWVALMCILLFSLNFNLFPTSGFLSPELSSASVVTQALDVLWHLMLPVLVIVSSGLASLIRFSRFSVISIFNEEYIKAARARGLSEKRIVFVHAFKNAALPIVTLLGGMLPSLFGGAFVVEYVFSWPGLGQLGVSSIFARDYPVIMGTLLISSILILLGNALSDFLYRYVDPRISS